MYFYLCHGLTDVRWYKRLLSFFKKRKKDVWKLLINTFTTRPLSFENSQSLFWKLQKEIFAQIYEYLSIYLVPVSYSK